MTNERRICTETYQYLNINPKGRYTGDCQPRAIALATNQSWENVVRGLTEVSIETGYYLMKETREEYLKRFGFVKQKQPRKPNGKKYTLDEFCKKIAKPNKVYVVEIANHLTCVKEQRIHDTWNCGYKCVGNYYEIVE